MSYGSKSAILLQNDIVLTLNDSYIHSFEDGGIILTAGSSLIAHRTRISNISGAHGAIHSNGGKVYIYDSEVDRLCYEYGEHHDP